MLGWDNRAAIWISRRNCSACSPSSQVTPEDFDRDETIMAQVAREIDGRHTAATNLPLDDVAVGKQLWWLGNDFAQESLARTY